MSNFYDNFDVNNSWMNERYQSADLDFAFEEWLDNGQFFIRRTLFNLTTYTKAYKRTNNQTYKYACLSVVLF